MPRPKSSLYRRKKHGHRKTAEVQEKKLLSAETVLGDDLVQSTVQEGSHGHGTQCLPHNPLSTEATLKPAKERVSPSPALAAMEVQCTDSSGPATPLKVLNPASFAVGEYQSLSLGPGKHDRLELPSKFPAWKLQIEDSNVTVYQILTKGIPKGYPTIYITHVLAFSEGRWQIWVHGKSPASLPFLLPEECTTASVGELLNQIEKLSVCQGAGSPPSNASKLHHVFVDGVPTPSKEATVQMEVLRDINCTLLASGKMLCCNSCRKLKDRLRKVKSDQEESCGTSTFTANVHLSTPEKLRKLSALAVERVESRRKIASLTAKVKALHAKEGISVDPELQQDLDDVMTQCQQVLPDGSFRKLFWEQQRNALRSKDPRQRRWHPLIIKWCLNLRMMSSAAYENLRTTGMLVLPSQRTLRDYANVIRTGEGFSIDVVHQLFDEARKGEDEIPYHRRFVGILFDELYIRQDLVYDKHSSKIIGFVNLGDVDTQLSALAADTVQSPPTIATRIMTLMVRGIFSELHFPLANFPTAGIRASVLHDIMWEATELLELSDFIVCFQTGDGGSPHRRYFKLHGHFHKAINVYSQTERWLYFFSDTPHLIKTARNSLSHSGYGQTRLLWNQELTLEWKHVQSLYETSLLSGAKSGGLQLAHKLTREHIFLTPRSRMRVDLAAQVLSKSVSEAMKFYNIAGSSATQTFLLFMDRFFDILNVRSTGEHIHTRKAELKPFTSADDERLQWLVDGFLGYLENWEAGVRERKGFSAAQKSLMLLSRETREGLKMTVRSFVELVKVLLGDPALQQHYILSGKFNQDPLENFFGRVRQSGGWSGNPSVKSVEQATNAIRLQTSSIMNEVRGAPTVKRQILHTAEKIDDTPLPKRSRSSNEH